MLLTSLTIWICDTWIWIIVMCSSIMPCMETHDRSYFHYGVVRSVQYGSWKQEYHVEGSPRTIEKLDSKKEEENKERSIRALWLIFRFCAECWHFTICFESLCSWRWIFVSFSLVLFAEGRIRYWFSFRSPRLLLEVRSSSAIAWVTRT